MTKSPRLEWLSLFAVRGFSLVVTRLPESSALVLGRFCGRVAFIFSNRRRVAYADLKAAFGNRYSPSARWQIIRQHYGHMGQSAVEMIRFPQLDAGFVEDKVRIHHFERFKSLTDQGHGAILLTAHIGNWELIQIISGLLNKPIHVLGRDQRSAGMTKLLAKYRQAHGSVAVSRGINLRDFVRAIRRGEMVGLLGDQSAGKHQGLILPFMGRKTTVPTGAFELAKRTGVPILPCFIVRDGKGGHEIFIEEPILPIRSEASDEDLAKAVKGYVHLLESMISRYPYQWLWGKKRWKYAWTKRLLVLSDGKAGHVKQVEAVVRNFKEIQTQYDRPGMEYPTQVLDVHFKSDQHRKWFAWICPFFLPWAQGRIGKLRAFFTKETQDQLEEASADFIISAGSSLTPLNLFLAKECRAKSVVLMKPSFPYNLFRIDLAIVPLHDRGQMPREAIRTLLTPSWWEPDEVEEASERLARELPARDRVKVGVFLGGTTRRYRMETGKVRQLLDSLERLESAEGDYIMTTSRRTPDAVTDYLKANRGQYRRCQQLIIAAEDKMPGRIEGMMGLAEVLVVTEDSISMISEAVSTDKPVVVLNLDSENLPNKHRRFQELLAQNAAVVFADPENIVEKIRNARAQLRGGWYTRDQAILRGRLQEIL
ncbi:MAG: ELM1/GtrOC1 family putative glycosyltransferase [Candidatus Omnitrophota bacterium]|nr:ELM1/GtrOC1 family putative glycosyltransferase [Candidatus Omnitrophota bacterium]